MNKIKEVFERSSTIDKIWILGLIVGCLLMFYFIYKNPMSDEKLKRINQESYEEIEEEELMM